ncbi:hypothetical protein LTR66_016954 [Elasticomyces elasticus]|nr:hypothetical protein LTR66_016954 [Elasticomyces elasticus]
MQGNRRTPFWEDALQPILKNLENRSVQPLELPCLVHRPRDEEMDEQYTYDQNQDFVISAAVMTNMLSFVKHSLRQLKINPVDYNVYHDDDVVVRDDTCIDLTSMTQLRDLELPSHLLWPENEVDNGIPHMTHRGSINHTFSTTLENLKITFTEETGVSWAYQDFGHSILQRQPGIGLSPKIIQVILPRAISQGHWQPRREMSRP